MSCCAAPQFVDVPPRSLLSPECADLRRPLIDMSRGSLELRPGDPRGNKAILGTSPQDYRTAPSMIGDTTTRLVADREGNVIAATPSGWAGVLAGDPKAKRHARAE